MCNTHYNPMQAEILEERDDAHLIHTECRKCSSSIIALVLTGGLGVSSVGLVTDLGSDEVLRFRAGKTIHEDEVLQLYQIFHDAPLTLGAFTSLLPLPTAAP